MVTMRRRLVIALAAVLVMIAQSVWAQTVVIDPNSLQFTASADHDATYPDGSFVVTSYRLDVFNSSNVIVSTLPLSKPSYQTTGCPTGVPAPCIVVAITSFIATLPSNVTMTAQVVTIGPGGSNASISSNPFARAFTLRAPAAVTNVKVIKVGT